MSNKASPCHYCQTIAYLQLKTIYGSTWWIHCDGCGQISRDCETQSEAGESWNEQQILLEKGDKT
jgi:hypothetical protein